MIRRLATPRYRRAYLIYWKIKTHLWSFGVGVLLVTVLASVYLFRLWLGGYLVRLDPSLLPQLCIGIGASLIGLIAVVFTLSLFLIQQISDRSVPGILREYAADNVIRAIYAVLSLLAMACLCAALLTVKTHPVLKFSLPIFCAISSLILLSMLFVRVAYLSDPSNIILHIWKTSMGQVKRLQIVQDQLVRLNPGITESTDPFGRKIDKIGAITSQLYAHAPYVTKGLKKSLNDLHSLMRHFSSEQQYSLLGESSDAIVDILTRYIKLRGSSLTMANTTTTMMGLELGWDSVVVATVEACAAQIRTAMESGDTQRAQIISKALARLAYNSVESMPHGAPPGEHPTVSFVAGYLTTAAKQAVVKRNEDVTISINEQLLQIACELAASRSAMTAKWLTEELSQIATLSILARLQTGATDTANILLKFLGSLVANASSSPSLVKEVRDVLMRICITEVKLGTQGLSLGSSLSASPDTPLRSALSGVSPVSIQRTHAYLVNRIAGTYSEEGYEVWNRSVHMLEEIDEGLWRWFEKIGLASVSGKESVLFYLNVAAYDIGEQLLWLWSQIVNAKLPEIDLRAIADGDKRVEIAGHIHHRREFKGKLEKILSWHVIAFYSRCRGLEPSNSNDSNLRDCFANAIGIAIQALGLGLTELPIKVAQTVGSSCAAHLNARGIADFVEVCRMASVLAELGLVSIHEGHAETTAAVNDALKAFVVQALEIIKEHTERFQDWSSPVNLVTERLAELADGQEGYSGIRLSVWRPSYTREEAREYLHVLRELLS